MSIGWCVRYESGRAYCEAVTVVKASPKQVVLKSGGWATGFKTHVPPSDVYPTEAKAREALAGLIERSLEFRRKAVADAERELIVNAERLLELKTRTPAEPSSS